jgi:hypothetical protein
MAKFKSLYNTFWRNRLLSEKLFSRSWKRRFIRAIIGNYLFGEYFCGGIALEATKE